MSSKVIVPAGAANKIEKGGTAEFSKAGALDVQNNGALLVETGSTLKVDDSSTVGGAIITAAEAASGKAAGVYYLEPGVNVDLAKGVTTMPKVKASDINLTTHGDVTITSTDLERVTENADHDAILGVKNEGKPLFPNANTPANFLLNQWKVAEGTGTLNVNKEELTKALAKTPQKASGRAEEDLPAPGVNVAKDATFKTQVADSTKESRADMGNLVSGEGTWDVNQGHFSAGTVPSNVQVDTDASLNVTATKPLNTTVTTAGTGVADVTVPADVKDASTVNVKNNAGTTNLHLNANNANVSVDGNKGTVGVNMAGTDDAPITTNVALGTNEKAADLSLKDATAVLSSAQPDQTAVSIGAVDAQKNATLATSGDKAPVAVGIQSLTGELSLNMKIDAASAERAKSAQVFVMKGTPGTASSSPSEGEGAQTGSVVLLNYKNVHNPMDLIGKHLRVGVTGPKVSVVLNGDKSAEGTPLTFTKDGVDYKVVLKSDAYPAQEDSGVDTANDKTFVGDNKDLNAWYLEAVPQYKPLDVSSGQNSEISKDTPLPAGAKNIVETGGELTLNDKGALDLQPNSALLVETGSTLKINSNNPDLIKKAKAADGDKEGVYFLEPGVNIDLGEGVKNFPNITASDINLTTADDVTITPDDLKKVNTQADRGNLLAVPKVKDGKEMIFTDAGQPENFLLNQWHIKKGTGTVAVDSADFAKVFAPDQQTMKGRGDDVLLPPPAVTVDDGATLKTQVADATQDKPVAMGNLVSGDGTWNVNKGFFTASSVPSKVQVDAGAGLNVTTDKALKTTVTTTAQDALANITVNKPASGPAGLSAVNVKDNQGTTTVAMNVDKGAVNVTGNKGTVNLDMKDGDTDVVFNDAGKVNLSLDKATAMLKSGDANSSAVELDKVTAVNDAAIDLTSGATPLNTVAIKELGGNLGLDMKIDAKQSERPASAQLYVMSGTPGSASSAPAEGEKAPSSVVLINYANVHNAQDLIGQHLRVGVTGSNVSVVLNGDQSATGDKRTFRVDGQLYEVVIKSEKYNAKDTTGVNTQNDGKYVADAGSATAWYLEAVPLIKPILTPKGQLKAFVYANTLLINDLPVLVEHYVAPVKKGSITTWAQALGILTTAAFDVDGAGYLVHTTRYGAEFGVDKAFVRNDAIYRVGLLGHVDVGNSDFGKVSKFDHLQWNVGGYLSYVDNHRYLGVSARFVQVESKSDQEMTLKNKENAVRVNVEAGIALNWLPQLHVKAVPHIQYQFTHTLPHVAKGTYQGQSLTLDQKALNVNKVRVGIKLTKDMFVGDKPSRGYVGFDYIYTHGLDQYFTANGEQMSILPNPHSLRFSVGFMVNVTGAFALDAQVYDQLSLDYATSHIQGSLGMSYQF